MLTNDQFMEYCAAHQLTASAIEYIMQVRSSEPSRMVGAHAKNNVVGFYFSEKMGCTISLESASAEGVSARIKEEGATTFEYWDQPSPISIQITNRKGVRQRISYTPDFLVLAEHGPYIEEAKDSKTISSLLEEQPENWQRDSLGKILYVPALDAFRALGLKHEVFVYSPKQHGCLSANLNLILQARAFENLVTEELFRQVKKVLKTTCIMPLIQLKQTLNLPTYTSLIQLIGQKKLFAKLDRCLLTNPNNVWVAISESLLAIDDSQLRNFIEPPSSEKKLKFPTEAEAVEALRRIELIDSGVNSRSIRRWKSHLKDEESNTSQFLALVPRHAQKGNRKEKIHPVVRDTLISYIRNEHAHQPNINVYRSFRDYEAQAEEVHPNYKPVCQRTFFKYLEQTPATEIERARGGVRAENAVAPPSDPDDRSIRAQLAWERATIDHALAKIWVVVFEIGNLVYAMRPWITTMVDCATGVVIALVISLKQPSRYSCAKVIRECVRRWGCLPREVFVDRGPDFMSTFFAALLAHYKVTLSLRPSGHPRYGESVEGTFSRIQSDWMNSLPGNMVGQKKIRSIDADHSAKARAVFSPIDFLSELREYTNWKDSSLHGTKLEAGICKFERDSEQFPFVKIPVLYDDEFLIASAVDCRDFTIDFSRGIGVDGLHYWNPNLMDLHGKKSGTAVRVDSEHPHVVYAHVNGSWVTCKTGSANAFATLDPLTQEIEGLILREGAAAKNSAKDDADRELARLKRKANQRRQEDNKKIDSELPVIFKNPKDIFNNIKSDSAPIVTRKWSDKND